MTKNKALYSWFNQFMTFYRDTAVPIDAEFPYGTYDYISDSWDGENGGQAALTVKLWYRTESEATPDEKAQEIAETIGYGGTLVECDEGYMWIKKGSPWCQSLTDDSDPAIKMRYINITVDFLTFD